MSFNKISNYVKLLLVHSSVTFKFINLNTVDNRVNLVDPRYNEVSTSLDMVSLKVLE